MKIQTKIPKLQMHNDEKLHKSVNENMFSFTFLCKFSFFFDGQLKEHICYSFTLLMSYIAFNPFHVFIHKFSQF